MSFDPAIHSMDLQYKTTSVLPYLYCQRLITTYNASILKELPYPLQGSFLTTAKDCLEKNKVKTETETKDRTVLATLINNLDNQKITPLPKIGFMEGPLNISLHWSNTFKKLIYIFGELHDGIKMCPPDKKESTSKIEDYLTNWFLKPTAYTDFYLEKESFLMPEGYPHVVYTKENNLTRLRDKFGVCIDKLTRDTNPNCNTSRMHFFDIRQGRVKGGIPSITQIWPKILDIKFYVRQFSGNYGEFTRLLLIFFQDNKHFFTKISKFTDEEYKYFCYNELYEFNIIKKEIIHMNEDVKPYLIYFIEKKLIKYIDNNTYTHEKLAEKSIQLTAAKIIEIGNIIEGTIKEGKTIERKYIGNFFGLIEDLFIYINYINALFTDAYLLARIFKTFNINDPEKRRLVDEPSEAHNIIIYAGNNHATRCREFLEFIGFKTLEKSGESFNEIYTGLTYDKCIDIEKENLDKTKTITQPLFNTWPSEEDTFVSFDTENFKKYESFKKIFNINPDDTMSEPEISDDRIPEPEFSYDTMTESEISNVKTRVKNKDKRSNKQTIKTPVKKKDKRGGVNRSKKQNKIKNKSDLLLF